MQGEQSADDMQSVGGVIVLGAGKAVYMGKDARGLTFSGLISGHMLCEFGQSTVP